MTAGVKSIPRHNGELSAQPVSLVAPGLVPTSNSTVSRRTMIATLVTAMVPVAGTSVVPTKMVETEASQQPPEPPLVVDTDLVAENPELLALGVQLEEMFASYQAAAARLCEARISAAKHWPARPPAAIVVATAQQRRAFAGCFEQACGFDGERLYRSAAGPDGKVYEDALQLNLLRSDRLRERLADLRGFPEEWEGNKQAWLDEQIDLQARLGAAERYEAACEYAMEISGIAAARKWVQDLAQGLHLKLFDIRQYVPRTMGGLLIFARAVAAYDEAQANSQSGGERAGGLILGSELAEAVLRIAGTRR
ncbi:hypothetical protein [Bradyrhizobium sp. SZCCHNS3004]|uniref:hypothetical protein n=1 Tax=Bradyrhizobium sp. SZCCHNS3004 TaxID=3057312 RepID=UPI0029169837|nr:hypothetical protein [Bradyrhizobium sp. SZCCHNS3004]